MHARVSTTKFAILFGLHKLEEITTHTKARGVMVLIACNSKTCLVATEYYGYSINCSTVWSVDRYTNTEAVTCLYTI